MTPVSRYRLSDEAEKEIVSMFVSELVKITDQKTLESFVSMLLSESEKIMLAKRLVAYVMVGNGDTDTVISRTLHLTRITVAKIRLNYLLHKEKKSPSVEVIQNPRLKSFLSEILKGVLKYAVSAAGGKISRKSPLGIFD